MLCLLVLLFGGGLVLVGVALRFAERSSATESDAPPCWGIIRTAPSTGWSTVHYLEDTGHLVMCTELELPDQHPGDRTGRVRTVCTRMGQIDQSHCARDFERIP